MEVLVPKDRKETWVSLDSLAILETMVQPVNQGHQEGLVNQAFKVHQDQRDPPDHQDLWDRLEPPGSLDHLDRREPRVCKEVPDQPDGLGSRERKDLTGSQAPQVGQDPKLIIHQP